ncbi:MAG: tetratricopeptide repeat protein [bacterium]
MGGFFNKLFLKLKERKVFRTLIIYLGGAWVAMQVISLFIDRYALSGFIFDMLMILIIAGIPGSVLIAWFHGESGTQKVTRLEIGLQSALITLAIIAGFITFNVRAGDEYAAPDHDENTIVVLPFENMSDNQDDKYFSDGITDDIITNLSKIKDVQVISRLSLKDLQISEMSINAIASKLNVNLILEGSVRRIGNQVRISAKLINVETEENIWAETYDREMTEVFAVQTDVARNIADNLQIKLSPKVKRRLEYTPTANLDAYDLYLKGRDYYNLYRDADNEIAIELFKEALKLDPEYAMAYAGLADAYAQRVLRYHKPRNWLDSTIVTAQKAIALDPEVAEGYKALGVGYAYQGLNELAIEANQKAIDRNPNFFQAINNLGVIYGRLGELDKQIPMLEKAIALAPLYSIAYVQLGEAYAELGFDEKAFDLIEESMQMQPDFAESYFSLGRIYVQRGSLEKALEVTRKGLSISPDDPGLMANMGQIEMFRGNYDEAELYLEKVYDLNLGVYSLMDPIGLAPGYLGYVYLKNNKPNIAEVVFKQVDATLKESISEGNDYYRCKLELGRNYAIQNKREEAVLWLKQAFESGWHEYRLAMTDPTLKSVRNDKEFKAIMDKMRRKLKSMHERAARLMAT